MWTHPATRINVERLRREFGYRVVEPEAGPLASGQNGVGTARGAATTSSTRWSRRSPTRRSASPTPPPARRSSTASAPSTSRVAGSSSPRAAPRRPIDPVRLHRQPEHGQDGRSRSPRPPSPVGARVTLVAGRLEVPVPPGVSAVTAESTAAMRDAVVEAVFLGRADALVMAAAVADFRPAHAAPTKLTRDAGLSIELEPTEDILAEVGARAGCARSPPGHRRVRGGDRHPRPGPREAAPEGRRPPRRQRRRRGRARGSAPRPTGSSILGADGSRDDLPAAVQARGRGPAAGPGREPAGRPRTASDERGTALDERGTPAQTGPMSTET